MIMIYGDWLKEFGFRFNQRLKISSSLGKIVIESFSDDTEPDIDAYDNFRPSHKHDVVKAGIAAVWRRPGVHAPDQRLGKTCLRDC